MSHDVDITVHHFHPSNNIPSPTVILDAAHKLIHATTNANWRSIKPLQLKPATSIKGACYVWARTPPLVPQEIAATGCKPDLEDWDAPLGTEPVTSDLCKLIDFESTDFGEIFRRNSRAGKRKARSCSPIRENADTVDVDKLGPQKRQRSCSLPTYTSISTLIPLPHYHESPDPSRPPPPEIAHIPAYRISRGILTTIPYSRAAWLVPLRGRPPFDGASSAIIYASNAEKPPALPPEQSSPKCILWSPSAVSQFWSFLLRQRSMNNFGPLALAYTFGLYALDDDKPNHSEIVTRRLEMETRRTGRWEYVKIFHDGQYALQLRSLLDSFRSEDKQGTPDAPQCNRLVKGACLALLDERGDLMLLA